MRNRAKCKLCGDIIESLHQHDYKRCKCNEIFIDGGVGGEYRRCGAGDWKNFTYLDDEGNEITSKVISADQSATFKNRIEKEPSKEDHVESTHDRRKELMNMLLETIKNSESLPPHVRSSYVTYLDLDGALTLIYAILKEPPS